MKVIDKLLGAVGLGGGGATPGAPGGDVSPQQLQELLNGVMQQLETQ